MGIARTRKINKINKEFSLILIKKPQDKIKYLLQFYKKPTLL